MAARLTMICRGQTVATRKAMFGASDEALEDGAIAQATALAATMPRADRVWTAPELSARQTAQALGLDALENQPLRDQDFGNWAGMRLADLHQANPAGLEAALCDPHAAPHGGETLAAFCARIAAFMQSLLAERANLVAVTHPAVMRAAMLHALCAPVEGFWRVDIEPLAQIRFTSDGRRWAVRFPGPGNGRLERRA